MAFKTNRKDNPARQNPRASTQKAYQETSSQIAQRGNRTRHTQEEDDEEALSQRNKEQSHDLSEGLSSNRAFQEKAGAARRLTGSHINAADEDEDYEDEDDEDEDYEDEDDEDEDYEDEDDEDEDEDYEDEDEDYDDDEDEDEDETEEDVYQKPFKNPSGRSPYQLNERANKPQGNRLNSNSEEDETDDKEEGGRMNNTQTARQANQASQRCNRDNSKDSKGCGCNRR
ncbi:hypothetical protein [Candidatus Protochlamydia phocaeensis]|uniref:hypothetical protein n=1 Tax=Candidatus Protochlamydia phocaeensis TaxID=1414722 RepID=UPI00083844B6|nr:hypothetical protein [Candidatus Protochlamydia phocaeensis]